MKAGTAFVVVLALAVCGSILQVTNRVDVAPAGLSTKPSDTVPAHAKCDFTDSYTCEGWDA